MGKEPRMSATKLIDPSSFISVPMVEEDAEYTANQDCPYGSDRCTKLGNLRFRPRHRIGECGGCKGVCEECELLLLSDDDRSVIKIKVKKLKKKKIKSVMIVRKRLIIAEQLTMLIIA